MELGIGFSIFLAVIIATIVYLSIKLGEINGKKCVNEMEKEE